ncbi:fanconi anemia group J protein [Paragonimus westermani]|uniref:Fanconi anemia group J protein n=1 Tax=Paragonimus westermani TaxID=34504 RepID=A0A5J4NMX5_9TREM|nr:fanconi anemia group J protein [Paragonimus westermani]
MLNSLYLSVFSRNMDISVQNVVVSFPYKPYGCQLSFMNRVIETLESRKNCLLESPTGTGKTLSLLCSSLAWVNKQLGNSANVLTYFLYQQIQKTVKRVIRVRSFLFILICKAPCQQHCYSESQTRNDELLEQKNQSCSSEHDSMEPKEKRQCPIFVLTTYVISYRMTILSSRQHTCINPIIKRATNVTEACQNLLLTGFCSFDQPRKKTDIVRTINRLDSHGAWDLEDFVESLSHVPSCPYFCARKLAKTADIIFCPYNYLLDPVNRSATDLELKNNVVILDEAHNIEDASREAASFKITEHQLLMAEDNLQSLAKRNVEPELCASLISVHVFRTLVSKTTDSSDHNLSDSEQIKPSASTLHLFESLFLLLRFMFRNDQKNLADYRVVLMETVSYERKSSSHSISEADGSLDLWLSKRSSKAQYVESRELSLNFWCLNPSIVFSELAAEVRCLILVSGTLSPLDSLEAELGVAFPVRLEANHVISKDRFLVTALSHGPGGTRLCATYQHQNTYTFQDELGQLVLEACRLVPGGVLCFLPSYSLLDKLAQRWETTNLISALRQVKHVMFEPRSSIGLDSWLNEFYAAVDDTGLSSLHARKPKCSDAHATNIDDSFVQSPDNRSSGALVFAVCRGKVSEGLDFADAYGRLVIAVGIPYPAFNNPLVQQKREFNDITRRLPVSTPDSLNRSFTPPDSPTVKESNFLFTPRRVLSGSEWYDAQAYRALNQALGRCIRHMNDWGAVLLADARFVEQPARYMRGISRWIRSRTVYHTSWSSVATQLGAFVVGRLADAKVEQEAQELEDIFAD